jgi:uncharacterized protein YbjQ (UPF0145 family)
MANISDAFGTIVVKHVGREFLNYLRTVQGSESQAYYKLVEIDQLDQAEVSVDGEVVIDFSTGGRWYYGNNLKGYLQGEWMRASEYTPKSHQEAYDEFVEAVKKKDGIVSVEYTDSDTAMDWMGVGSYTMQGRNGEVEFGEVFDEERITLERYCELYDYTWQEAIEWLYGDEISEAYFKHKEQQRANLPENEIIESSPAEFEEWLATYETQEV